MESSPSQGYLINESKILRVYPQRFWVLFIFALLSFNQCMFWLTFSPIAEPTKSFYHVTEATVDLLLNWGPIIFLPTLPLIYVLLNSHHGLRKCILVFAIVSLIATLLRLVPLMITSPKNPNFHDVSVPFLHISQILIAITGPIAMALVSQLSCVWFAPHERTRATTVAILGSDFGGAAAFVISPFLVSESWHIPRILYMHAGQALLACILTLAYFPAEPPSPPSVAADVLNTNRLIQEQPIATLKKILWDILHCCRNVSCVLLLVSGATLGGTFAGWSGLFATILQPLGYSEIEAGEKLFSTNKISLLFFLKVGLVLVKQSRISLARYLWVT
jgi:FLVCR family MFS transporter